MVLQRPTSPTAGNTRDDSATYASGIFLFDDLLHPQLVSRVQVREEKVHRDRLYALALEIAHRLPHIVVAERYQYLAFEVQPLLDFGHQMTRRERLRIVAPEAEEFGCGRLAVAAQVGLGDVEKRKPVSEPLGGDGPRLGARPCGHDVGGQCRPEDDGLGGSEQLRQRQTDLRRQLGDALDHAGLRVGGGAVSLGRPYVVRVAQKDAVSEGPAAVDGDTVVGGHPAYPTGCEKVMS